MWPLKLLASTNRKACLREGSKGKNLQQVLFILKSGGLGSALALTLMWERRKLRLSGKKAKKKKNILKFFM